MNSNIKLVISREYRERVGKKSFLITTILMPILMLGLMVAPALIMSIGMGQSKTTVVVVDNSGIVANELKSDENTVFMPTDATVDSAMRRADADAILVITRELMTSKKPSLKYYSNGPSSMLVETTIRSAVNEIVEQRRLRDYDIENLGEIMQAVECDVDMSTVRLDRENAETASSELSSGLGIMLTFVLYMFLLLYGQMVMTSIIEEKNNRVLEIVVSSVKPAQMMMGKIIGVALVAVTQIVIWGVLIAAMSSLVLPAIMPDQIMADVAALNAGNTAALSDTADISLLQAVAALGNVGYILQIMGVLTLFLVGGFLFYASIYAAIGSAVDNIQDASQLQTVTVVPVIIGLICAMGAATDPNTPVAFWMSIIPFTSPMVMMARVPFGIPAWEIIVSLALLFISFIGMVWVAAKIYRVGIFMYGKKPTVKELIRWVKYK